MAAETAIEMRAEPWTEEAFLALPVDRRIELLDGGLVVSPSGSNRYQQLCFELHVALAAAAPGGYRVLESPNVRLRSGRILIPDVVVLERPDMDATVNEADVVRLVIEVVSPGNAFMDRAVKPSLYAEAGIARYLRVEHDAAPEGNLHVLEGGEYHVVSSGPVIELDQPFPLRLDVAALAL